MNRSAPFISTVLIQRNHPDLGWLFYDRDGDGKPDSGYARSFPLMDVVEIHPISNALRLGPFETLPDRKGNNRSFNWLQLAAGAEIGRTRRRRRREVDAGRRTRSVLGRVSASRDVQPDFCRCWRG